MRKAVQTIENVLYKCKIFKYQILQNTYKFVEGHKDKKNNQQKKQCSSMFELCVQSAKDPLYFTFLSFIGLGSKTNSQTNKRIEEDIAKNEWKREKDLSHHIAEAEGAIKIGDFKKAEVILEKALAANIKNNTVGVSVAYDMLATLAFRQNFARKAAEILERGIDHLTNNGTPLLHNCIVDFRLKLARIHSRLGNETDAEKNFKKCLAAQKLKHGNGVRDEETTKLWINALYWYGKHLVFFKRYLEARQCFDSAYTLCAQVKTIDNDQVMVMLYNLSEVSYATGDKDGALRHLLNAVILGRNTNSPDLPMYYNKIGIVYLSKGILREAKKWCENGKEKSQKIHNKHAQQEAEDCIKKINEILKISPLTKV